MKLFNVILFIFLSNSLIGQDSITVTLFDYKTNKQIQLPSDIRPIVSLISNNEPGERKMKFYHVSQDGQFVISKSEIDSIGDKFTFSVNGFYEIGLFSYADFEIRNIPKDSIKNIFSKIYLTPSYWVNSCGSDCFLIDNQKTFKKKHFIVSTPFISYRVKRVPEKINQKLLDVKYVTDLEQDVLR